MNDWEKFCYHGKKDKTDDSKVVAIGGGKA
jgi:hypothetical protein